MLKMTLKQVYTVNNNQLTINLPEKFRGTKQVMVIVEDIDEVQLDKYLLMKKAATDLLFLSDIQEISSDFKNIDSENI
jgi:hypothetical protein